MKNFIKKTGTVFLLLLAAVPVLYLLALQGYQQIVQAKMRHELEAGLLTTITLSTDNVHWTKKGKEITVDGKMFDVKKVVNNNDGTLILTGLFDEEETLIVKQLQKTQEENNSKSSKQLLQLFSILQSLPENTTGIYVKQNPVLKEFFISDMSYLPSPFISIPTPPPLG